MHTNQSLSRHVTSLRRLCRLFTLLVLALLGLATLLMARAAECGTLRINGMLFAVVFAGVVSVLIRLAFHLGNLALSLTHLRRHL